MFQASGEQPGVAAAIAALLWTRATSMLLSSRTFLEGPSLSCQCPNDQPAPADLFYRWRSRRKRADFTIKAPTLYYSIRRR